MRSIKFWAFDTETVNRSGRGEACLLVLNTNEGVKFLESPSNFDEVFNFLASKPCNKLVAFNMDFDTRAIIHPEFLPWRVVEEIGLFGRWENGPYTFRYISSKFMEVKGKDGRSFIIYDLQQFFGTSLEKALEKFCPDIPKHKIPQAWYNEMDRCLKDERRSRILAYAERDVVGAQRLIDDVLLKSLRGIGLRPRRLSSCASLARLKYGKVLGRVRAPDYVNRLFERGFYGGRIECAVLGKVKSVKLYDINSAYPSVLANLKDPSQGVHTVSSNAEWSYRNPSYGLYFLEAEVPRGESFGPLAMRERGRVFYPVGRVRTWCCLPALESLRKSGFGFKVKYAYEIFGCEKPIFDDIESMYLQRKNSDIGLAIKLCLNAIYGLTAEATNYLAESALSQREVSGRRVVSRSKFGKLTNFVLASHITESIRMKIWEVMRDAGSKSYFAATDGVLVDSSYSLPTDSRLGAWGLKGEFENAVILGSGRYLLTGGLKPDGTPLTEFHLRGFPVRRDLFDKLEKTKRSYAMIDQLDTMSLRQWASNMAADSLNVLAPSHKRLEVSDDKRFWLKKFPRICDYFKDSVTSKPYIVG